MSKRANSQPCKFFVIYYLHCFPLRGKVGQLTVVRRRECFVGLSLLLVYDLPLPVGQLGDKKRRRRLRRRRREWFVGLSLLLEYDLPLLVGQLGDKKRRRRRREWFVGLSLL